MKSKNYIFIYNSIDDSSQMFYSFLFSDFNQILIINTFVMENAALVIVDPQNDFCEGGSLGVTGSNEIFPAINSILKANLFSNTFMTLDWHPENHISFAANHNKQPFTEMEIYGEKQMLWPTHCIENSHGSSPSKLLKLSGREVVVKKGVRAEEETYSGFGTKNNPTELKQKLKQRSIKKVFVVGLALDYCVGNTAIDAKEAGFDVYVIEETTKPVSLETGKQMIQKFSQLSINYVKMKQIEELSILIK